MDKREWIFLLLALAILFVASFVRLTSMTQFSDGDEYIYAALVQQLQAGRGYTLRGHPLLNSPLISKSHYDSAYFFHPPVGVFFFYLVAKIIHPLSSALRWAQIFSFAIFYFAMLVTRQLLQNDRRLLPFLAFALLVAFTPIYAHTNMKAWIDNPRLAFFALHFVFLLYATQRPRVWALLGVILSSLLVVLSKVDGLLALPFVQVFVLLLNFKENKKYVPIGLAVLLFNLIVVVLWLWLSNALHYAPGHPSQELLNMNPFIRYVTLAVSPWIFFIGFAKVVSTFLPSAIVLLVCRKGRFGPPEVLLLWVFCFCSAYFLLGSFGYSRVLRYLLFVTPACLLLFSYAIEQLLFLQKGQRGLTIAFTTLLLLGFGLEIYQGVQTIRVHNLEALIEPSF